MSWVSGSSSNLPRDACLLVQRPASTGIRLLIHASTGIQLSVLASCALDEHDDVALALTTFDAVLASVLHDRVLIELDG
jgi:hypothetical protein